MCNDREVAFVELIGKTVTDIQVNEDKTTIRFVTPDADYVMTHFQDCCEEVYVESIVGDVADIIGHEIRHAEESTNEGALGYDHYTWTFYSLRTDKGYLDIRWVGSSNGYYSERVDLIKEDKS